MALTVLQRKFVNHYLVCNNATEAAALAGYKGDRVTLASVGYENLRKPQIAAEIEQRMREYAMSANEVLFRLTQHGRGDLREFVGLSAREIKTHPGGHVIKKFKQFRTIRENGDIEERIELELYDAQSALEKLGRYHELFVNRTKVEDWRSEAIKAIRDGEINFDDLAEEFDNDLATELFALAGVPVQISEG